MFNELTTQLLLTEWCHLVIQTLGKATASTWPQQQYFAYQTYSLSCPAIMKLLPFFKTPFNLF